MDEKRKKIIYQILEGVKLEVQDVESFGKDIDNILEMFDLLKNTDIGNVQNDLERKKITLDDLRGDDARDANFRIDMRGKYFKVPRVSKK